MFTRVLSRLKKGQAAIKKARTGLAPAPSPGGPPRPREAADEADGILAIVHRLSQPLTALRGTLEIGLLTDRSPADYRAALEEALQQADRLIRLLGSLRELAEAGEAANSCEPLLLNAIVRETFEYVRAFAESRGVSLALDSRLDLYVRGNPERLREGLLKAVYRAIERSPTCASVRVSLAAARGSACLDMSDQGPPLTPDELEIFDHPPSLGQLFSEAAKYGSLEWSIAKKIFEAGGASVRIVSHPRVGCTFRLCWPLAPSRIFKDLMLKGG